MADLKLLAHQYVLEDDSTKQHLIAQNACSLIQDSKNSTIIREWVECVRPWIVGDADDSFANDEVDRISRSRALGFLADTLQFMAIDYLRSDQVQVLISFFTAMYSVNAKYGIANASRALLTLSSMKETDHERNVDILRALVSLGDTFRDLDVPTRRTVYQLAKSLLEKESTLRTISADENHRQVIYELGTMCQAERDPTNLLLWFSLIQHLLSQCNLPSEHYEHYFTIFSAYFPISLRSSHASGLSPETLKAQLRLCFSSTSSLSKRSFSFLIEKLDAGSLSSLTVNVKLDILRTLIACLDQYDDPARNITPYADLIWDALKLEIRNEDNEEVLELALQCLSCLTRKQAPSDANSLALRVLRECVDELDSIQTTPTAAKLMLAVFGATPEVFALTTPLAFDYVENILNATLTISKEHIDVLVLFVTSLIELRPIVIASSSPEQQELLVQKTLDLHFSSLYRRIFEPLLANSDRVTPNTIRGVGLLASQSIIATSTANNDGIKNLLLDDPSCSSITGHLIALAFQSTSSGSHSNLLVDEAVRSLQKTVTAWPNGFNQLLTMIDLEWKYTYYDDGFSGPQVSKEEIHNLLGTLSRVAFIGCSDLPNSESPLQHVIQLVAKLLGSIKYYLVENTEARSKSAECALWFVYPATLHAILLHFQPLLHRFPSDKIPLRPDTWCDRLRAVVPDIPTLEVNTSQKATNTEISSNATSQDVRLLFLHMSQQLIRCATTVTTLPDGRSSVDIVPLLSIYRDAGRSYLDSVSRFVSATISLLTSEEQDQLQLHRHINQLFHSDPQSTLTHPLPRVPILSAAVACALSPTAIQNAREWAVEMLQEFFTEARFSKQDYVYDAQLSHLIMVLANKIVLEKTSSVPDLLLESMVELRSDSRNADTSKYAQDRRVNMLAAYLAGALRRYSTSELQVVLQEFRSNVSHPVIGNTISQSYHTIFNPATLSESKSYLKVKGLWAQKSYYLLVKPLLTSPDTLQIKAILLAVSQLPFSIYEEDAPLLLRLGIRAAKSPSQELSLSASFQLMSTIQDAVPQVTLEVLSSVVSACVDALNVSQENDTANAELTRIHQYALQLLGRMPSIYESRHLLSHASRVRLQLMMACGHPNRDVRKAARISRQAWQTVG